MLNEAQLRHLSAVMRVVEERLTDLQLQLNGDAPKRTLLELGDDLRDAERAFVAEKIAELLALITAVTQQFSLNPKWRSLRRTLVASLSIVWGDVRDVTATAMGGYGDTDPRLHESLDPLIERICDTTLEICRRLREGESVRIKEEEP